jgi:hypothetical protein
MLLSLGLSKSVYTFDFRFFVIKFYSRQKLGDWAKALELQRDGHDRFKSGSLLTVPFGVIYSLKGVRNTIVQIAVVQFATVFRLLNFVRK